MSRFPADSAKTSEGGNPGPVKGWLSLRRDALNYGVALLATAVALAVWTVLTPILPGHSPYLFFVPAVLVAAGLGGWGPGLAATALGVLLGLLVAARFSGISVPAIAEAVAFTLVGAGMAWGGEQLRRNRIQAVAREAHLTSILDTVTDAMI